MPTKRQIQRGAARGREPTPENCTAKLATTIDRTPAPEKVAPPNIDMRVPELMRRDVMMRTVNNAGMQVLTAESLEEELPKVLSNIAEVIRMDRLIVVEMRAADGIPQADIRYGWTSSRTVPANSIIDVPAEILLAPEFTAWLAPLYRGEAITLSRPTASVILRRFLDITGAISLLLVPIMVHGRHWGQIAIADCRGEREWIVDEVAALEVFAGVLGAAITRERSFEELSGRDELLRAVNQIAGEIVAAPHLHEAIADSLEKVARAVRADRVVVLEVVATSSGPPQLLHRNSWHSPEISLELEAVLRLPAGTGLTEYLRWTGPLQHGEAIRGSMSRASAELKDYFIRRKLQSTLVVPIMVDGKFWGQITFDACSSERQWSGGDTDILKTLAELIGASITRERHVDELRNANTIVQNSPNILYRLRGEPSLPMVYVSRNVGQLGYDPAELLNSPTLYQSYVHPEDRSRVQAAMVELLGLNAPAATVEYRIRTGGGESRWMENRCTPVRDTKGRLIEIEGIMVDVTERKAVEEKITRLARTDALTGLANRGTFNDRLKQAFAAAQREAEWFAILYLDLDRFKEVNDTLGHPAGDRLLQEVAERLQRITRETDLAARLGGDEFAILHSNWNDPAAASVLASRIIEGLSAPYVLDGNEVRVGVSVGIAGCSTDNMPASADELLARADQALYRAKEEGRGQYRFHSAALDLETRDRVELVEDLRMALGRQQFELNYQRQIELSSGRVTGMEALIRWNHPVRGILLPEVFLPIAERSGLTPALGRWVLDKACQQLREWRDAGAVVPLVAVNVDFAQLRGGREFIADVKDSLARWNLRPADLELDVTELVLALTTLAQNTVLEDLHEFGVRVAIDDFGTQYSSLNYLRRYHISRLRIARAIVESARSDPSGAALLRAITGLAAELGVEVIADGVESESEHNQLVYPELRTIAQRL